MINLIKFILYFFKYISHTILLNISTVNIVVLFYLFHVIKNVNVHMLNKREVNNHDNDKNLLLSDLYGKHSSNLYALTAIRYYISIY